MDDHDPLKSVDSKVAETLFQQHLQFRSFLTKHLGNQEIAEDILQECMAKALQSEGQLQKEESITAWFYRILRNAMTDYFRSRSAEDRKTTGYLEEIISHQEDRVHAKDEPDPELCRCFSGLLDTLKPAYGELLRRIDLGSESVEQVARDLDITQANLHVRLHRARQALKTSLERSCGTCAEHGCLDCECQ